ncbi:LPS-assembly protein LptD [Candidatus Fermentibacteria bacterium]|nr:LPS-assembly protein LptD [Candidatus Fermentibacteria bacterium]
MQYRADESTSNLRTGAITLRSNVVAWNEEFVLHAAWGTYRLNPEEILLGGGVRGTWRGDSATSATARVIAADSLLQLDGAVFVKSRDGSELTCSHLLYRDSIRMAFLSGPVSLTDSTGMYRARSDTAWYRHGLDEMHLADRCTLFIESPPATPIRVASDSTVMARTGGTVTAIGNVTLMGDDLEGSCQTLSFLRDEDRATLEGSPALAGSGIRCHAARIVVQRRDGELRQIVLEGNAWAAQTGGSPADSSAWNQAWGDRMVVWLVHEQPQDMVVTGSARALHRVQDRGGTELGRNDAKGDSILLGMGENVLRRVRIAGTASGTYTPLSPGTGLPGETLDYAAQTLVYSEESGVLVMEGPADLTSGSARLTADEVRFSPTARDMVARGNAVLRDGAQDIKGDVMTFDVDRRQGVVREGFTQFEQAFSLGKRVARIDSRRLSIAQGRFTTCDLDHPHFCVTSPKMRVELDNKIVARSLVLHIHDVPLLYLPYWIFPIRRDRHSGFLMPSFSARNILGLEGSRAGITGLGYYLVLGDYADAEATLDWREGLGWTLNTSLNYALRYRIPNGALNASYARRDNTAQWTVRERHEQLLPRGWRLTANVNATKSKSFIDQETWGAQDRLDLQAGLNSDITLAKTLTGWALRATLRRDQNWESTATDSATTATQTITSVLPEISVSRPSKRIFPVSGTRAPWYKELYASLSTTFSNRTVHSDVPGAMDRVATGTMHAVQFSWQLPKVLRHFSVSPRAAYNESWIHRGNRSNEGERMVNDRFGVLHSIGVAASTKLYGLWSPPIGGIEAIRHVVSPQLGFGYTPDWFFSGWDFSTGRFSHDDALPYTASGFGGSYAKSRRLSMSMGNVFQVKLCKGENVVRNDNLANLNFSTAYDFEAADAGGDPWSLLASTLSLSPGGGFSWNLSATHDPNEALEFMSATSTISARVAGGWNRPPAAGHDGEQIDSFRGTWDLSATHSFSHRRGMTNEPQTLRVAATITPTRGWNVRATVNYDMLDHRAMNKSLSLTRDLHCWQADFSWYQAASQWHYLFKIFVKAYPQSLFVKHEERG